MTSGGQVVTTAGIGASATAEAKRALPASGRDGPTVDADDPLAPEKCDSNSGPPLSCVMARGWRRQRRRGVLDAPPGPSSSAWAVVAIHVSMRSSDQP